MAVKDVPLEQAKYTFLQAYNQEAKRLNSLLEKYPDNESYKRQDENLKEFLQFFDYATHLLHLHQIQIKILELENKALIDKATADFDKLITDLLNNK